MTSEPEKESWAQRRANDCRFCEIKGQRGVHVDGGYGPCNICGQLIDGSHLGAALFSTATPSSSSAARDKEDDERGLMIRVVHKRPGLPAEVVMIEPDLESIRGLIDGGYITGIRLFRDIHGYVDDEGLLKDLPLNFVLDGSPIVGPAMFSKVDEEGDEIGFESDDEAMKVAQFINERINVQTE